MIDTLKIRQALVAALIDPSLVLDATEVRRRDGADFLIAVERGHAFESESVDLLRLTMVAEHRGGTDVSMVLQGLANTFASEHKLSPEQMIEALGIVLGRYAGFAALAVLEKGREPR